jgi:hypothetical protein
MKQYILPILLTVNALIFTHYSSAQNSSHVIQCKEFHKTLALIEINQEHPVNIQKIERKLKREFRQKSHDKSYRKPQHFEFSAEKDGYRYATDSSMIQQKDGTRTAKSPIQNWQGITANGMYPLDPTGAASSNRYLQATNSTLYKVYNKANGNVITSGTLGNLWSPASPNDGDPIVMYDRFADRWFISQFGEADNSIYIAISQTNDPAGAYYTYTFTSPEFPDYLKFSIWQDGYYMTSNQNQQKVFAFERTKMLNGDPNARAVYTDFSPPSGGGFFVPLPADADGNNGFPENNTPCPIFSYSDNAWSENSVDAIQIYEMTVDWSSSTPSATINFVTTLPTAAFDASYDSNWNDIPQPGTSQKLDGIGGVLNYRAQWRKWMYHNSVVLTWAVKVNDTKRSLMWCELRQDLNSHTWSIYQQGIYAPDNLNRWVGSIAMDDLGNIGLCYTVSGASTKYPSLAYTGRLSSDPLNTMTFSETTAIEGVVSQTGTNRFGDYAHTTLDPDGSTFWHTGEYMGGNVIYGPRTRIYSFRLQEHNTAVVAITSNKLHNTICVGDSITFFATPFNGGNVPVYQWQVNGINVGTNSAIFSSDTLSNGAIVTCIMTSNDPNATGGLAHSNQVVVNVRPFVNPSLSLIGDEEACFGQEITYSVSYTNGGTSPIFQWYLNGNLIGNNEPTLTYFPSDNDSITCVMTSNDLCITEQPAFADTLAITIVSSFSTPTMTYDGFHLISSSITGNQWYLDGQLIPGSNSQILHPESNGYYSVSLNSGSCISQVSDSILVSNASVQSLNINTQFKLFPNPSTNGDFTIQFNAEKNKTYELILYDQSGKTVLIDKFKNQYGLISKSYRLNRETAGTYTLILSNGGNVSAKRFVIGK